MPNAGSGREIVWEYQIGCEIGPTGDFSIPHPDPALTRILGVPIQELMAPGGWMNAVPPADVPRSLGIFDLLAQGRVWEGRIRTQTSTGEILVLHLHAKPTPAPDGRVLIAVQARDVTEVAGLEARLAEREGRLRLLEQELNVVMWTTDDALRFTWSTGPNLWDPRSGEDAWVGQSLYDFFGTSDPEEPSIAAHYRALKGEAASYDAGWQGRSWRAWVEPYRDVLGRIAGVLGVAMDLTALMDRARATQAARDGADGESGRADLRPDGRADLESFSLGNLVVDPARFEAHRDGVKIALTVTEFRLLLELARHPDEVLSRETLSQRIWGHASLGNDASLTMAVSRLREKIEKDPTHPVIVETVRGIGYKLGDTALS